MTNTQIVATLSWTDAPPDLSCVPGDLNELGQVLSQFLSVNSTTNEIDTSSQTSIAQQALTTANAALATAEQALAAQPSVRSSGSALIALSAGNPVVVINLSPPMNDENYIVLGTFFGPTGGLGVNRPTFRIKDGGRTINSCTLLFDEIPSGFSFAYIARSLTS